MKKFTLFLIVFVGILLVFSSCSYYKYDNANKYTAGETELSDNITKIEIEWINGNVSIDYHNKSTVSFSEESKKELSENETLHYYLEGTTLHIKFAKSGKLSSFNFDKELAVLLPEAISLSEVEIETVSANVEIAQSYLNNTITELNIETVSGNVDARLNKGANSINIESVSGDVNILANVKKAEIETVSGYIDLIGLSKIDECALSSVSGKVNLGLISTSTFTLETKTISGNFECEFETKAQGDKLICGDGKGDYDIETTSGNIKIYVFADVESSVIQ